MILVWVMAVLLSAGLTPVLAAQLSPHAPIRKGGSRRRDTDYLVLEDLLIVAIASHNEAWKFPEEPNGEDSMR
jgi:hypothetical protein